MVKYIIYDICQYTSVLTTQEGEEFIICPEDFDLTQEWEVNHVITWIIRNNQQYLQYDNKGVLVRVK